MAKSKKADVKIAKDRIIRYNPKDKTKSEIVDKCILDKKEKDGAGYLSHNIVGTAFEQMFKSGELEMTEKTRGGYKKVYTYIKPDSGE